MAKADTDSNSQSNDRCAALTADGDRCSRPPQEDGFCYQHDESDSTVSESQEAQQAEPDEQEQEDTESEEQEQKEAEEQEEAEGESEDEQEQDSEADTESADSSEDESESEDDSEGESESQSETTEPEAVDTSEVDADNPQIAGLLAVRRTVQSTAGEVIGRSFDGVSEITPTDDGWRSVVEVVERTAVPDTQDIIGRYEIDLDEDGVIEGYRRLDRYRRGDTAAFEQ